MKKMIFIAMLSSFAVQAMEQRKNSVRHSSVQAIQRECLIHFGMQIYVKVGEDSALALCVHMKTKKGFDAIQENITEINNKLNQRAKELFPTDEVPDFQRVGEALINDQCVRAIIQQWALRLNANTEVREMSLLRFEKP